MATLTLRRMRKLYLLSLFLCIFQLAVAQRVRHRSYTVYYNASKHEPDSVSWNLDALMISCTPAERSKVFKADVKIASCAKPGDYDNNRYVAGLLFNPGNIACNNIDAAESYFMSNALPMNNICNTGDWLEIEKYERLLAATGKIHVIAGGWGALPESTKAGLTIPAKLWKAIYAEGHWLVWIVDNTAESTGHDYKYWMKPVSLLNSITTLNL